MELTKVTKTHLVNSIELSFYNIVKNLKLGKKLNILSVSAGSGYWDEKIIYHLKK